MPHLTWWSVLILALAAAIGLVGGRLLGGWIHQAIYRFALATHTKVDDRLVARQRGPVIAACMVGIWDLATTWLPLPANVLAFAHTAGGIAFLVVLAWAGLRVLDGLTDLVASRTTWIASHRLSQGLLPLGRRVAKVTVAIVFAMMILAELGYSIGPLIAGLGITGIAVALAAQKTLGDVFGAFAIGLDHPFREGDFIRLENGLTGAVETIGLRSTRIRTLDRTLVTVPNGKLADAQIEALTARDRMRFDATFHLALGTSAAQLERVLADVSDMLLAHPRRAADEPSVHLTTVADAWIEVEVMVWLATTSWSEFQLLRDRLLIRCVELVTAAGASLHNAPAPPVVAAPPAKSNGTQPRQPGGMS